MRSTGGLLERGLAVGDASAEVVGVWDAVARAATEVPVVGLAAGERPADDVEVLARCLGSVEHELGRRMLAASTAGCLPLVGDGAMLLARGWSSRWARRLARCAALAARHPSLSAAWASGVISSEHIDPLARRAESLTEEQLAGVVAELDPLWGQLSPPAVARFVAAVVRMLHPPPDPDPEEIGDYEARSLSFSVHGETVLLAGSLPRVEGEAVIAAVEAFAERLRSAADHVPATARRADGLVALVNAAHAAGALPTRGGLPTSVSVTLSATTTGDLVWTTSRGHWLSAAEGRFAACDAVVTPIVIDDPDPGSCSGDAGLNHAALDGPGFTVITTPDGQNARSVSSRRAECAGDQNGGRSRQPSLGGESEPPEQWAGLPSAADRIAALAASQLATLIPLAVGRSARTATPAQRRALAARDRGCIIPGCAVPAEACQTHHVREWAEDGPTDLANLVLLCWSHHRQVELRMWSITPGPGGPGPCGPEALDLSAGGQPGTAWPGNNGAPWTVTRIPRTRWRL